MNISVCDIGANNDHITRLSLQIVCVSDENLLHAGRERADAKGQAAEAAGSEECAEELAKLLRQC